MGHLFSPNTSIQATSLPRDFSKCCLSSLNVCLREVQVSNGDFQDMTEWFPVWASQQPTKCLRRAERRQQDWSMNSQTAAQAATSSEYQ